MSIQRLNHLFAEQYLGRSRYKGNLLLNGGINVAWGLICAAGGTAFSNANAYIGVGDSATAAVATQTGIQAATNRLNVGMDATYPLAAAAQAEVWRSTFTSSLANFAWNEIVVSNANDFVHGLNRLVQTMGTKASGATWVASLTITLS
jgi:tetrahydromethanopterin S-methyltransferase subunit D